MSKHCLAVSTAAVLAAIALPAEAALYETTVTSHDRIIGERQSNALAAGYYTDVTGNALMGVDGSSLSSTRKNQQPIIGLTLPVLAPGESIDSAQLTFSVIGIQDQGTNHLLGSLDTYLLSSANPSSTGTGFFYEGNSDPSASVEFVGRTTRQTLGVSTSAGSINPQQTFDPPKQITYTLTGDALALLQSFYTNSTPNQTEAFFRWNSSTDLNVGDSDRYVIDPNSPKITITAIPEPAALSLLALGGLLTRRRSS
jgi:hypothetical protein